MTRPSNLAAAPAPVDPGPTSLALHLAAEGLLGLTEAVHAEGLRVSVWTTMRWSRHGLSDGTRLEAVKVGGRWYSSRAAVRRFLARQAQHQPLWVPESLAWGVPESLASCTG